MLRVLVWLGQFLVVAPSVYEALISLAGLRTPEPATRVAPRIRVRAVVPAHDEASVIEGIAADLAAQEYPDDLLESVVIADRCTDDTARLAGDHVPVAIRSTGGGAKGAAIAWYLDAHPLSDEELLVILDADNRIGPEFIARIATAHEDGHDVIQAYLDVTNPDASAIALANALTYWASNRSVQLARSNLGWSCDLGGTGMAVSGRALAAVEGVADDLTEDLALNVRLNLAGYRAHFLHDVRVRDEKPVSTDASVVQRARWVRGKRSVQKAYGASVVRRAVTRRDPALIDLAFRLFNPGRSFLALALVVLTIVAAVFPDAGLWPAVVLAPITATVVLLPLAFLIVEGVPGRYLVRYPYVVILALLWFPIRIASRLIGGWRRTQHSG